MVTKQQKQGNKMREKTKEIDVNNDLKFSFKEEKDETNNNYWNDRVVFMQTLPFLPLSLFDNFNVTILLSVIINIIYVILIQNDDGDVWTKEELESKEETFTEILFSVWIPIYVIYLYITF